MPKPYRKPPRILELVPGIFSWTLITFPVWGSLFIPHIVAYFVIGFCVFWLYKSLSLGIVALMSHYRLRASQKHDWLLDVQRLPNWGKVIHLVVIPTYKEPVEVLQQTLLALKSQDFPLKKLYIVLGCEEREAGALEKTNHLLRAFEGLFGSLWVTVHQDKPGEVKGKASNEAFATKWAKTKLIDELGLDMDFITVSSVDADARFHPKYFAALTYEFLKAPNRYRAFFQPMLHFYNNIWRVPAPIRVVNTFSNIWQTGKLSRPDKLINCSTYSASLKMIDEVGYWDVDVIPEDYRIYFKCLFAFHGNLQVIPIFLPVSLDAAEGKTYWRSLVNQYEQLKRWAWGTSDDPWVLVQFWKTRAINPFKKVFRVIQVVVEEHFLWPVNWFIITLGATIPPLVNPAFKTTVLGQNLSTFPRLILSLTLITLVVILIIDARQRPPRPVHISLTRRLLMNAEFVLMPIIGFFFSALPGIDAHTRLMMGKYLEYKVTEKIAR